MKRLEVALTWWQNLTQSCWVCCRLWREFLSTCLLLVTGWAHPEYQLSLVLPGVLSEFRLLVNFYRSIPALLPCCFQLGCRKHGACFSAERLLLMYTDVRPSLFLERRELLLHVVSSLCPAFPWGVELHRIVINHWEFGFTVCVQESVFPDIACLEKFLTISTAFLRHFGAFILQTGSSP